MVRTPAPKEQARILREALSQQGIELPNQKSLDIVARMNGHKNWNVLSGEHSKEAHACETPALSAWHAAIQSLLDSEDSAGCDAGLTVVSSTALDALRELAGLPATAPARTWTPPEHRVAGFSVDDVLSVRPDLTREEAIEVLWYCERNFDASLGLNWDVLEAQSLQAVPEGFMPCSVADSEGLKVAVVSLFDGAIYLEHYGKLKRSPELLYSTRNKEPFSEGSLVSFGTDIPSVMVNGCVDLFDGDCDELAELADRMREAGMVIMRMH